MKKKVIAGNWKMNKTPSETKALIEELAPKVKNSDDVVIVCPTAVCLPAAVDASKGTNIKVGAQNMYFEKHQTKKHRAKSFTALSSCALFRFLLSTLSSF